MKKHFLIVAVFLVCNTTFVNAQIFNKSDKKYKDDIYYNSKDAAEEKAAKEAEEAARQKAWQEEQDRKVKASQQTESTNSDDYSSKRNSTNQSTDFDYDDYYDYSYSARIRRFHRPVTVYSYYDPYYTNAYWYDPNPFNYGSSIYLGYNWWGPSYYNYYCWGPGWYRPYTYWGWNSYSGWNYGWGWGNGWGNPYPWGYNYWNGYNNGYWHGYWNGYNNGYWNGLNNSNNGYYFNSHDVNSYNPSNTVSGPRVGGIGGNGRLAQAPRKNFTQQMTEQLASNESGPRANPYIKSDRANTPRDVNAPIKLDEPRRNPYYNNETNTPSKGRDNANNPTSIPRTNPYNNENPGRGRNNEINGYENTPRNNPYYNPNSNETPSRGNNENTPRSNPYNNPNINENPGRGNYESTPRTNPYKNETPNKGNTTPDNRPRTNPYHNNTPNEPVKTTKEFNRGNNSSPSYQRNGGNSRPSGGYTQPSAPRSSGGSSGGGRSSGGNSGVRRPW